MKITNHLSIATLSLITLTGSLQANINLGAAADFVALAKTAITTTSGSSIVGDLGINPAALSDIQGFNQTLDASGQFATSSMVTGKIFAADMGGQTSANLNTAVSDMESAYTDAANRSNPDFLNLGSGNLNSTTQNLTPGLYKWTSNVTVTDSVTIDAQGDSNAFWIFQVDNRLSLASSAQIFLSGNANVANIFWQTAEGATLGTNSHFEGTILTQTDIAMQTDASMVGRLLAQTAVTFESNNLTVVPEPSSYAALLGLGALSLVAFRRRMKEKV